MKHAEPPSVAAWMLEHCTAGDFDEALAGDLCEGYSSGLSDRWYWRQVLAACAVSWSASLRAHMPAFVFALLWSMMAPAWKVFTDPLESAPIFDRILPWFGPVWVFPALAGWLLLNSIFLWTGILVFVLFSSNFSGLMRRDTLRRSFLRASLIFLPTYAAAFLFGNLYWYSFFPNATLAATPLAQIADLRMLADAIRIPYFIALLGALCTALPRSLHSTQPLLAGSPPIESSTQSGALTLLSVLSPYTVKRFFAFMVGAGLINAMLAGILLCRLLPLPAPTLSTLFTRSILYVVVGILAGVAGSWLYWKNPSSLFRHHAPIPFPLFALVCASGWIWVPSLAIFSDQLSPAAAIVSAIGALFLAAGLRHATLSVFAPAVPDSANSKSQNADLFSQALYRAPWEPHGYVITFLLYAGACALAMRFNLLAAGLLALSAFLFVWKLTSAPSHHPDRNREYRRAALMLAYVALPAVLVTAWALLDGVAHRNRIAGMNAAPSAGTTNSTSAGAHQSTNAQSSAYGLGAYESLILYPVPEKKQIVPPLPERSLLAPGTTQPLIIPFSGQYWYMQPPSEIPGPAAHQARGTPLAYEIASINSIPLVMDAHQTLSAPIPIARCRQIQVEIENRDNKIGLIALAVLLTNTASPQRPALYLGQQPILSTEPERFSIKSGPLFETLRFSVPANANIRGFDEITVMMLPDIEHALTGPRIAIKQFQLFPR